MPLICLVPFLKIETTLSVFVLHMRSRVYMGPCLAERIPLAIACPEYEAVGMGIQDSSSL